MNCELANDRLVECARSHALPDEPLAAHVAACETCRERWEAERELTSHLRMLRIASVPASIEWSKAVLMREFDANRRRERQVRWMWAMSSAAVLVLSLVAVRDVRMRPVISPARPGLAKVYPLHEYPEEVFAPAEEVGEEGFIKVPFALPPVPGETSGIVRTQLAPADLVRMGVNIDPSWTGTLQADLWVGQDGFPEAVRLSNDDIQQN